MKGPVMKLRFGYLVIAALVSFAFVSLASAASLAAPDVGSSKASGLGEATLASAPASSVQSDGALPTSSGAAVLVKGAVQQVRLIIVDGDDNVTEIWSNASGDGSADYSLMVREGSRQGEKHPLTPEILSQYNSLLDLVDWGYSGRVY